MIAFCVRGSWAAASAFSTPDDGARIDNSERACLTEGKTPRRGRGEGRGSCTAPDTTCRSLGIPPPRHAVAAAAGTPATNSHRRRRRHPRHKQPPPPLPPPRQPAIAAAADPDTRFSPSSDRKRPVPYQRAPPSDIDKTGLQKLRITIITRIHPPVQG